MVPVIINLEVYGQDGCFYILEKEYFLPIDPYVGLNLYYIVAVPAEWDESMPRTIEFVSIEFRAGIPRVVCCLEEVDCRVSVDHGYYIPKETDTYCGRVALVETPGLLFYGWTVIAERPIRPEEKP